MNSIKRILIGGTIILSTTTVIPTVGVQAKGWDSSNLDKWITDYNASKYEARKDELAKIGIQFSGQVSNTDSVFLSAMENKYTGWVYTSLDDIRYMKEGEPVKGWCRDGGAVFWRYYDLSTGIMKTGWLNDKGNWYYLFADGSMASCGNVNGYEIASDGHWTGKIVSNATEPAFCVSQNEDTSLGAVKYITESEFTKLKSQGKIGVNVGYSKSLQSDNVKMGLRFYLKQ